VSGFELLGLSLIILLARSGENAVAMDVTPQKRSRSWITSTPERVVRARPSAVAGSAEHSLDQHFQGLKAFNTFYRRSFSSLSEQLFSDLPLEELLQTCLLGVAQQVAAIASVARQHGITITTHFDGTLPNWMNAVRAASPVILLVGVNPSRQAQRPFQPFQEATASGSVLRKFLDLLEMQRVSYLLWNIAPLLTLAKDGRDFAYDAFISLVAQTSDCEAQLHIAELHMLHMVMIRCIWQSKRSLVVVWTLGRSVQTWLQPLHEQALAVNFLTSPHPAHALRTETEEIWLQGMKLSLASVIDSGLVTAPLQHRFHEQSERLEEQSDDEDEWSFPSVMDFLISHRLNGRVVRAILRLNPILQKAVMLQASLNFADDEVAALFARVKKARAADFKSVVVLVLKQGLEPHAVQQFMSLTPPQQRAVMCTPFPTIRQDINGLLIYRINAARYGRDWQRTRPAAR
jgi:hypothetical protein